MTRMMIRGLSGGFGFALLAISAQAWAFGLGNIHVRSYLGQPFLATIPIQVDSKSDLDGLKVSLGSPEQFSNAGIEASAADYSLHFKIQGNGGHPFVKITSRQPIRVPFLNFIIQARWGAGTLLRQYTVLINPAEYGGGSSSVQTRPMQQATAPPVPSSINASAAAMSSGGAKAVVTPSSAAASTQKQTLAGNKKKVTVTPSGQSSHASNRIADGSLYGPIQPGEPFWNIASRARPPGKSVTMDQVLLAIYEANPRAFAHDDFRKLMKGRMLRIPSVQVMRRIGKKQAHRKVMALMNGTAGSAVAVLKKPHPVPSPKSTKPPAGHAVVSASKKASATSVQKSDASIGARAQAANAAAASVNLAAESVRVVGFSASGPSPATSSSGAREHSTKTSVIGVGPLSIAAIAGSVLALKAPSSGAAPTTASPGSTEAGASGTGKPVSTVLNEGQATQNGPVGFGALSSVAATVTAGVSAKQRSAVSPRSQIDIAAIASGVLTASSTAGRARAITTAKRAVSPAIAKKQAAAGSRPKTSHKMGARPGQARGGWMAWVRQWREPIIGLLVVVILLAVLLRRRGAMSGRTAHEVARHEGSTDPDDPVSMQERRAPVVTEAEAHTEKADFGSEQQDTAVHDPTVPEADEVPRSQTNEVVTDHFPENQSAFAGDSTGESPGSPDAPTFKDPIGDADFHIEYGLHDEAIRILESSLEEDPKRRDVKIKLAECYSAVGNAAEFERIAEELHGAVAPDDWRRLAEMGRRLCPAVAMFQSSEYSETSISDDRSVGDETVGDAGGEEIAGKSSDHMETSTPLESEALDLSGFDEPADESLHGVEGSSPFDVERKEPVTDGQTASIDASGFKNIEDEAGSPFDANHLIEFNAESVPDQNEEAVDEEASVKPKLVAESSQLDVDPKGLEPEVHDASAGEHLEKGPEISEVFPSTRSGGTDSSTERVLDAADGSADTEIDSSGTEPGETGYKLDLARAYADMGDNSAARELIDEVIHEGDGEQQVRARKLLEELAG